MTAIYGPRGLPLTMPANRETMAGFGGLGVGGPSGAGGAAGALGGAASGAGTLGGAAPVSGPSFADRVSDALQSTNDLEVRADAAADGLVNGEHHDVHGTMIAMQEADVAFRLVTSVRNRVVEAYREVMRMGA